MGDLTWSFHFVRTTVVPYGVDREHMQYRQRERERGGGEGGWKRERERVIGHKHIPTHTPVP